MQYPWYHLLQESQPNHRTALIVEGASSMEQISASQISGSLSATPVQIQILLILCKVEFLHSLLERGLLFERNLRR